MRAGILERDGELTVLAAALKDAGDGHGSVVLISGEAGIGKSSLVQAVRARLPAEGRMLIGYCDDLATPRTLGPFRDLAGRVGTRLSRALGDGGDRDGLLAALYAELDWADHPAVLAVEDVHWADDATLDALRYLIRRIAALPAVLILTYRDDELGREHGLRGLLGQASRSDQVRRLPLSRLSADAVRRLSAGSPVDAGEVFGLTAGNPFFVHELLVSARGERVPPSIADAVLARVRRLDPVTQDVLEQLAVVPAALEPWLVGALVAGIAPDVTAVLAAAEQGGLLTVSPRRITFRHELTRRAIAGAVPAARLIALNQRVLEALTGRPGADVARIVHHAAQAGDAAAIVAYGPGAAREAARAGAHREAAAHYRLVLEHAGRFAPPERAGLLEEYGVECYTLGTADTAVGSQRQAVELNRTLGDPGRLGGSLRWLSRMYWWAAWLRGDLAAARDLIAPVHAEAARLGDAVHQSELGYWLAVAGARPPGDEPVAAGPAAGPGPGRGSEHPYALLAAGRWREAASAWATAGCRYEQAMALAASPGPADLLAALALLDDLGAKPLATRVRGRLRALGVARIPRGPLGGTRANPAGLTTRQVDVLRLLVQGHTNAQIARQLVLSVRTVDSHVAAVLGKLGAHDRHDAATRAAELGVLADQ